VHVTDRGALSPAGRQPVPERRGRYVPEALAAEHDAPGLIPLPGYFQLTCSNVYIIVLICVVITLIHNVEPSCRTVREPQPGWQ
jgi:hypothetical protein